MTVSALLDVDAARINLKAHERDPLSFKFIIGADWSGTYTAQIRVAQERTSTLLGTLTVVANLLDAAEVAAYAALGISTKIGHTEFTLSMTAAANTMPPGTAWWDLQQTGGVTRLAGKFIVIPEVTV